MIRRPEAGLELPEPEKPRDWPPVGGDAGRARSGASTGWSWCPACSPSSSRRRILTYSVAARYFLKIPTEWQDETSIFLLVGATFLSGPMCSRYRGHVGVEAVAGLLAPRANRWRKMFVDLSSGLLRVLLVEVVDPLRRGLARRPHQQLDLGSAAVDPLRADGRGHDVAVAAVAAGAHRRLSNTGGITMSSQRIGISYGVVTLLVMFSGMPIAFALGGVASAFMYLFMPASALDTMTQNVYEEMASITLLSIPLFILKGAAIGKSAGRQDLYSAMHAWMHKIPGGLGIANVFACALFAAMSGSSPPPARPSAARASPRCASAAIRPASPQASSRRAARWASCFRRRSR